MSRFWKAGDTYRLCFATYDQSTGGKVNADSTPTFTIYKNGVDDTANWTDAAVANLETGLYEITGTVPAGCSIGDCIAVIVKATVGSVALLVVNDQFQIFDVDGFSMAEAMRLVSAMLLGKASGGGTGTVTFRDVQDARNAVVMTVNEVGDRSAVTLAAE